MYFVLSKVLWLLAGPTNLLALATLAGGLLGFTRFRRAGRALTVAGASLLLVIGLLPVGTFLILPLEQRFPAWRDDGQPFVGVIVLGGAPEPANSRGRGQLLMNEGAERLVAMADLARRYPEKPVVFTGGSGDLVDQDSTEAAVLEQHIGELGLAPGRITFERRSRNTYENALFTRDLVKPQGGQRWLLVTSAYHMPRSMGLFRAAGFDVVPFPVDYRTAGPGDIKMALAVGDGLKRFETATREWIGLAVERAAGHTRELFPG
ncbi:membrane protein [Alsobacter metallidurans]|uniref:Membrane protein n=1 Tax=Alsobacter metallidurans TaxID=340221 RepID=A0A917MIK7_9HYPH|nr:YdcF family protein [Alsobacter metallidurans]GGH25110.1 membrane protein [Alsobacter metallidurans]